MGGFPWSHWYLCVLTYIWEWVSGRKRVISRGDPWLCCPVVHVQKLSHHRQIVILIGVLWEMYDYLITIKFLISFHCCDSMFSIHYSVESSVTDRKPIGSINANTFPFLRFCIFISQLFLTLNALPILTFQNGLVQISWKNQDIKLPVAS